MTVSLHTLTSIPSPGDLTLPISPQSAVMVRAGNTAVPLGYTRHRCVICNHPCRRSIEVCLSRRWTVNTINSMLPEQSSRIDRDQVVGHLHTCMMSHDGHATLRRWMEDEANGIKTPAQRGSAILDELLTVLERAIDVNFEELARSARISDIIAGVKLANDVSADIKDQHSDEVYQEAFVQYLDAVRANTSIEQQRLIAQALMANPVLRVLSGDDIQPTIVETTAQASSTPSAAAWDTSGYEG